MSADRKVEHLYVENIETHDRMRALNDNAVGTIAESMEKIGLRTPISVRYYSERPDGFPAGGTDDALVLMTGAHRLAAAKRLGWEKIECFVHYEGDEIDAQLWEIAENLHRAELSALERDEQVALWVRLNKERVNASQVGTHNKRGQVPGGVNAAARELGIGKNDAHRAVKVAGLSDEAKQAAREAGLEDNRTALLDAAKHKTVAEQVSAIHHRVAPKTIEIPDQKDWETVEAEQKRKLMRAWNDASPNVQAWFRETVADAPVMDRRFG